MARALSRQYFRLASRRISDQHLAGLAIELTAEDWSGRLTVRSGLDGGVINSGVARYRALASRHLEVLELDHLGADTLFLRCRTNQSLIQVPLAAGIGIEMRANALHFDPALPDDLRQIKVRLRYRRQLLNVEVDHDVLRIGSRSFTSVPIKVAYRGHYRDLAPGEVCQFRLIKPEERNRDENRTTRAAQEPGR